jgi:hypothetical protein
MTRRQSACPVGVALCIGDAELEVVLGKGVLVALHEGMKIDLNPPTTQGTSRHLQLQLSNDVARERIDVRI